MSNIRSCRQKRRNLGIISLMTNMSLLQYHHLIQMIPGFQMKILKAIRLMVRMPKEVHHPNVERMYMRVHPLMGHDLMKTQEEMTSGRNTPSFEVRQNMYEHRDK